MVGLQQQAARARKDKGSRFHGWALAILQPFSRKDKRNAALMNSFHIKYLERSTSRNIDSERMNIAALPGFGIITHGSNTCGFQLFSGVVLRIQFRLLSMIAIPSQGVWAALPGKLRALLVLLRGLSCRIASSRVRGQRPEPAGHLLGGRLLHGVLFEGGGVSSVRRPAPRSAS